MTSQARFAVAGVAALVLFAAAYGNSLHNSFHFDDSHVVEQNMFIRDVANIPRFFADARTFSSLPMNAVYRPMVSTTLAIDYRIAGGLSPVTYHVTQLVLFAALGALLVLFYRDVLTTADSGARTAAWAALVAATLFCVHTANTQPANYISARSEILSALGVVGGMLIYGRSRFARRWHLYLLPVLAGALAKNLAVMFAPLLLAYRLLIEEQLSADDLLSRTHWTRTRAALLATLPAFVVCALIFVFIERMNPPTQSYGGGTRTAYLATQTWMWVRYLGMYVLPVGLTADSDYRLFRSFDARMVAGVIALLASLAAAWWTSRWRTWRPVTFGVVWFWLALVPTSSIVPLAEVTNDHRMFFPYIGLNLAAVWTVVILIERTVATVHWRRAIGGALAVLVLLAHTVATHERNRVWRDEETLWADAVKKSPMNGRGLMNYGLSQMRLGRYLEAREIFQRAARLTPRYPFLEVNLGIVNAALNDQVEAERHFTRAISLDATQPAVHRYYARWLVQRGRGPEAVVELQRLLELTPGDGDSRHDLMALLAARGDSAGVHALARDALGIAHNDVVAQAYARDSVPFAPPAGDTSDDWYRLGWSYTRADRHVDAAQAYRVALRRDPVNADAWNNLGWTLGTLGFYPEAVPPLERAIELRANFQLARNNLSWIRDLVRRHR